MTHVTHSLCVALVLFTAATARAQTPTREHEEFFEKHVRPILVESCIDCHGPEKQRSGLRLDSREAILQGSGSTVVVVPGDPDKSPLIKAVKHEGDVHMPPRGRLPDPQVEALATWVRLGLPWPEHDGAAATRPAPTESEIERVRREHWAFRPVQKPPVPGVKNEFWPRNSVDHFVLAALEARELAPAPRADRRTLIRRATFDLHGLPPAPEEVDAFVADPASDHEAFAALVERLLASPRYGERWGRHWLDVARYADTKGYVFNEERRYPYSYTYRDWVIRAFNEDLPYDRFVMYQLAADLMPLGDDTRPLAAMGFLTLGRRFINNIHDIIDDRIDVTTRGLMGLTVSCARCHDHKFDPVPTADYYSLYGVFSSSVEPAEKPLVGMPTQNAAYRKYEAELAAKRAVLDAFARARHEELVAAIRRLSADYLTAAIAPKPATRSDADIIYRSPEEIRLPVVERWRNFIASTAQKHHPVFAPWHALAALKPEEFNGRAPVLLGELMLRPTNDPTTRVNTLIVRRLIEAMPSGMGEVARVYGRTLAEIDVTWQTQWAASTQPAGGKPITALANAEAEELRQVLYGKGMPAALTLEESPPLFDGQALPRYSELAMDVERFQTQSPEAPPRAMTLTDGAVVTPAIFVRGNPSNRGKTVPRQFLAVLSPGERKPFPEKSSGRLELAQHIASRDNPLTARVFVNRVWMHHFGAGLVRTPSDFGTRGEPPTHPELLDHLATQFMENGWSVKRLHRLIMLSSTYAQSCEGSPEAEASDPENRLLHRQHRRRLDFEAMRDGMLAMSGRLDLTMGGPPVEITEPPFTPRRTVYGFIDRQNLPAVFRMFDFASPDTSNAQRHMTTVPQQALFLMNSPFIVEQARAFAARADIAAESTPQARVERMYRLAFGRAPSPDELAAGVAFVTSPQRESSRPEPPPIYWQYGYGEYDAVSRRLVSFTPYPRFDNQTYKGKNDPPDPEIGWSFLNPTGGHPGDAKHSAIRRWIAPCDGTIRILGELVHPQVEKCGNGVVGWIHSSRIGSIGRWEARYGKVQTTVSDVPVQAGDTIDFIADSDGDLTCDSFHWQVHVSMTPPATSPSASAPADTGSGVQFTRYDWSSVADFGAPPAPLPPPLEPWGQYAQVLLLANEFAFVD